MLRTLMGLLALLVLALAGFFWWGTTGVFSTDRFDPGVWHAPRADHEDAGCYRGGMAKDIQKHVVLPGMTEPQVEAVLGEPDHREEDVHSYVLGMCSSPLDYDDLVVQYDEQGQVVKVSIVQN